MKWTALVGRDTLAGLLALAVTLGGYACAPNASGALVPDSTASAIRTSTGSASTGLVSGATITGVVLTLPDVASIIEAVKPSVVSINTTYTEYFFRRAITREGAGSGWIAREDGLIVTNSHVVEHSDSITVTLEDGSSYPAEIVGDDASSDLAIIKIGAHNLPALEWRDSSSLRVGDWVVAMGNSLGMGISATLGIVSALDISLDVSSSEILDGLIQTDAAINPGNSGGPLVNVLGQVIGINSVKVAQVGVEGMGYAIGADEARPVIQQLASMTSS